jgi:hypothetical protein
MNILVVSISVVVYNSFYTNLFSPKLQAIVDPLPSYGFLTSIRKEKVNTVRNDQDNGWFLLTICHIGILSSPDNFIFDRDLVLVGCRAI